MVSWCQAVNPPPVWAQWRTQQPAAPIMNGDAGPPKNAANFAALTPLHFLERAAEVFPERPCDALLVTSLPAEIVC